MKLVYLLDELFADQILVLNYIFYKTSINAELVSKIKKT